MNGWVFFNNVMFGFLMGLTMGFVDCSRWVETDKPAYLTAFYVGHFAGWATIITTIFYLINTGILR